MYFYFPLLLATKFSSGKQKFIKLIKPLFRMPFPPYLACLKSYKSSRSHIKYHILR